MRRFQLDTDCLDSRGEAVRPHCLECDRQRARANLWQSLFIAVVTSGLTALLVPLLLR